jgi:ketol-acid reductoisomerase
LAWAKAIGCTRAGVIKTTFRELVYFECLHELKFIVDLIHEEGIAGMHSLVSDTATWGDLAVGPRIIDRNVRKNIAVALRRIRRGDFAREFIREMKTGRRYTKLVKAARQHPIESVGRRLRGWMSWKVKTKQP